MAKLGRINSLKVLEFSEHGLYLDAGQHDKILLPNRFVMPHMRIGSIVETFIYNDSEDRLVATTETPFAQVGEFAYLEVVHVNPQMGVFLNWGLSKDLLMPFREQGNIHFRVGDCAVVAIYVDKYTNRVVASTRLHKHLCSKNPSYEPNEAVKVLIYGNSPLGYKAIIDKRYRGLIYHEETSDKLEEGDQITGYIKKVHSNGKIDLRRDPSGYARVENLSNLILEKLEAAGGTLPFGDKSKPDDIRSTFNSSKKAFKQALGRLFKQQQIYFKGAGISLKDSKNNGK